MNISLLRGALRTKRKPHIVLRSDNLQGFTLVRIDKATDKHFYNDNFVDVMTNRTRLGRIEKLISY